MGLMNHIGRETRMKSGCLAEAVRFELTEDSHPRQFSSMTYHSITTLYRTS